jgi:homocysteine S-methyltransferase
MSKYRQRLPQLGNALFITEGGIETTLVFHENIELPYFASFDLLKDDAGWRVLRRCYDRYAEIARASQIGIVLETPTWRASADWGARLGYDAAALADINRKAVSLLLEIRDAYETARTPVVISGNLGPRGDGYRAAARMTAQQARDYHAAQIATFAQTDADMTAAFTMNYIEEAVGIVQAARMHAMPVAISFTLETDGRLPSGDTLEQAITRTDAETDGYATYYMINCAHPVHFLPALATDGAWRERIRGVRANASRRSHAELDECTDLDFGNPHEFGGQYRELKTMLPRLSVMGGCCGTDHRHVDEICRALLAA